DRDQRNFSRPVNTFDIGAFESGSTAEAPGLVVTTGADVVNDQDGFTSLREAVAYAAARPGADTITFGPGVIRVTLTSDQITPNPPVTTAGPAGGVTIARDAAAPDFRIFEVASGVEATLRNLTITGGFAAGLFGSGGGIYNAGTLTVAASTLSGN